MQDGRPPIRRGSSGSISPEQPAPVLEVPSTLRTSPLIYAGAVSPDRKKFASYLVGGIPHCPPHQPKAPLAPPGAAISAPWTPFQVVPLPPRLVFETWWHEGPKRVNMHVTYDTATRRCTAGTHVSIEMDVSTTSGAQVDEYDLHVGAELRVAERKVTLRKAVTLATLTWLDQQARAMLVAKFRLEQELSKFRPVVPVPAQYTEAKRAELFDLNSHQHLPAGGRLNLRALYNFILGLVEQLRHHRARLPPLPEAVSERLMAAFESIPGPPDWSPERREAEQRDAESRQGEAQETPPTDDGWRNDLTNWLDSIPLAASCCTRYPGGSGAGGAVGSSGSGLMGSAGNAEGRASSKDKDRTAGRGHAGAVGSGGHPAVRPGGGATAGGHGALAFNMSVINRYGHGGAFHASPSSPSGAAGGGGTSRLHGGARLSSPKGGRTTYVGSTGPASPGMVPRQR